MKNVCKEIKMRENAKDVKLYKTEKGSGHSKETLTIYCSSMVTAALAVDLNTYLIATLNLINPTLEGSHSRINARILGISARNSPRHNSNLSAIIFASTGEQWTSRISLQRVIIFI